MLNSFESFLTDDLFPHRFYLWLIGYNLFMGAWLAHQLDTFTYIRRIQHDLKITFLL